MRKNGLDQLIVTQPQAIYYLTGLWCNPMDRLDALVITHDKCRMLCYVLAVIEPEDCEVTIYSDTGVTVPTLSSLLEDGVTGVDGYFHSRFLLPLMQLRPQLELRVSTCVEDARMIKTPEEIQLLRRASEITDDVFADAFTQLREGMTELELGAVFSDTFLAHGVGRFAGDPMVCFGAGSAEPHHEPGTSRLQPGDAVCVDTGKRIGGYYSDMTRTVFYRSVSDEQKKIYNIVLEAQKRSQDAVAAGKCCRDIDAIARNYIYENGYEGRFGHGLGHSLGIDIHENPRFNQVCTDILKVGQVMTVEPGIYLPGIGGVRIENSVVVTENGCEALTTPTRELIIL